MTMTTCMPKISIVCAWYNRADHLDRTVGSLLAQEYPNFDVTIVNDGSTDPRVRHILDGYADPRIRIFHTGNAGFVGAIRLAINASDSELIAIQGAGDISGPHRLKVQADHLMADPDCIGVSCMIRNVHVGGDRDGAIVPQERPAGRIDSALFAADGPNPMSHGEVTYRRSAYEKAGGYRDVFRFAQDRDLWLRLIDHGHFHRVDGYHYDRMIFAEDGISANLMKTVSQMKLSHMARQNARIRARFGADLVDVFADQATLYANRTSAVANYMASAALHCMLCGMEKEARLYMMLALQEKWTPRSLAVCALVRGNYALFGGRLNPLISAIVPKIDRTPARIFRS